LATHTTAVTIPLISEKSLAKELRRKEKKQDKIREIEMTHGVEENPNLKHKDNWNDLILTILYYSITSIVVR